MTDQVTIGNLALDAIGARSEVASFTENSQLARTLSLHWAPAVEAVLQAAHWNFARKQVALTLLKDATATPPDAVPAPWLYEYALPNDCVQARYLMPQYSGTSSVQGVAAVSAYQGTPIRFLISNDSDSNGNPITVILTNEPQATLVYTFRAPPALFDGSFVIALSNYIGARICTRVNGDKALAKMAFQLADQTTREARSSNGNEGLTVIDEIPDWMRVRGYASDWAYPPGSIFWTSPQNLSFVT